MTRKGDEGWGWRAASLSLAAGLDSAHRVSQIPHSSPWKEPSSGLCSPAAYRATLSGGEGRVEGDEGEREYETMQVHC